MNSRDSTSNPSSAHAMDFANAVLLRLEKKYNKSLKLSDSQPLLNIAWQKWPLSLMTLCISLLCVLIHPDSLLLEAGRIDFSRNKAAKVWACFTHRATTVTGGTMNILCWSQCRFIWREAFADPGSAKVALRPYEFFSLCKSFDLISKLSGITMRYPRA